MTKPNIEETCLMCPMSHNTLTSFCKKKKKKGGNTNYQNVEKARVVTEIRIIYKCLPHSITQ